MPEDWVTAKGVVRIEAGTGFVLALPRSPRSYPLKLPVCRWCVLSAGESQFPASMSSPTPGAASAIARR
jgi:hypothetical protein